MDPVVLCGTVSPAVSHRMCPLHQAAGPLIWLTPRKKAKQDGMGQSGNMELLEPLLSSSVKSFFYHVENALFMCGTLQNIILTSLWNCLGMLSLVRILLDFLTTLDVGP